MTCPGPVQRPVSGENLGSGGRWGAVGECQKLKPKAVTGTQRI
jgi:hypothetical protein